MAGVEVSGFRELHAAFSKESRMKFPDPTKLDRKSGAAEGSAVPRTFLGNVFRQDMICLSDREHALNAALRFVISTGAYPMWPPMRPF
jgi:DNA phosphorothioation-dependent restriction protein DptG